MTIAYCRNDPVSSRWVGLGRLLTEFEVDYNFYQHETRLAAVEGSITVNVSISSITQPTSNTLLFTMSDSSTQGPFTLPTPTFRDRGTWATSTVYAVNDTFTANGSLYRVLFAHTSSATSFSSTANDGAGHDYYATMLSNPGHALPAGGATEQVLQKSSGTDYAVSWGYKLPIGGAQYQVLMKTSSANQDATWQAIGASHVSFTGSTASTLSSTNVADALEELASDHNGTAADLATLTTTVSNQGNLHQMLDVAVDETDTSIDGYYLKWNATSGKWEAQPVAASFTDTITFVIDGGGATITTGMKGFLEIPFGCTITAAKLFGDQTGGIVVDIYKCTYSQFDGGVLHPQATDKITSSSPPTILSSPKSTDTTLSGWTTSISAGDILGFNVNSVTSITRVTLSLTVSR